MKKRQAILKGIGLSLFPAVCAYLSTDNSILVWLQTNKYLGENVDVELVRNIMYLASILLTFLCLTIPYIIRDIECNEYKSQRDMLIKDNKDIFEATLKNELNLKHCKINVRIFVPKYTLIYKIARIINKKSKLEYHIRNIEGLAEKDITENLKFSVFPKKQGLVGECYRQQAVLYDDDLVNSNETDYGLTMHQIAKTNKIKFILVCPVFSDEEKMIAIVSFDSYDEIKIMDEKKDILRNLVLNYTQSLYECVPDLFKAKGGIV